METSLVSKAQREWIATDFLVSSTSDIKNKWYDTNIELNQQKEKYGY